MLSASGDIVCFLVIKGRQFQAKTVNELPEDGSDLPDDPSRVLVDSPAEDSVEQELVDAIKSLNERGLAEVVALVRIGQGEYTPDEWDAAVEEARQTLEPSTPRQLIAMPMFAAFLEEGYSQLGYSCADWEADHL